MKGIFIFIFFISLACNSYAIKTQTEFSSSSPLTLSSTNNVSTEQSQYRNTTIISSIQTKFTLNKGFEISKHDILEPSLETETARMDFKWIVDGDSSQNLRKASSDDDIVIYVLGDIPYTQEETSLLSKQIQNIPSDAMFIVHVGDIMSADTGCPEEWYVDVRDALLQSNTPVFITPGDNDWSDCSNPRQGWDYWYRYFSRFDENFPHSIDVTRQNDRIENVSFFMNNYALFLQVHLVGLPVRDQSEWDERLQNAIDFTISQINKYQSAISVVVIFGHTQRTLAHDGYFKPLYEVAKSLSKPMFYIHGDGHVFSVNSTIGEGLNNFVDIEVDQGRKAPPLKVIISRDAMQVAREY